MPSLHIPTLIVRKREGEVLSDGEIRALIAGFTKGEVTDAQMSAFAMAVFFRGMTAAETASLTYAMLESGERFHFSGDHPPIVDKHSTGGIGDKVSLILAPLVACCGCWIPMVSGRGLGITGGTLDKLESIPGFRVGLSIEQAQAQLQRLGVAMMGQTEQFCPADKKFYALRDVTGTVPSIPLITASIMSKKLAESLDRLVLDVKYGSGAFMGTREQAEVLAASMQAVGKEMGVEVFTQLNPMSQPLGCAVGNALEVVESLATMRGDGPADLVELVVSQTEMITGVSRETLLAKLASGEVWEKFAQIVEAQGGDVSSLERLDQVHAAPVLLDVCAPESGTVTAFDAGMIGQAALELGAGRGKATDPIDPRVGFDALVKVGAALSAGDRIARIHAADEASARRAEASLLAALRVS
jgi:pyrimidine-nucleoside phosphorylase